LQVPSTVGARQRLTKSQRAAIAVEMLPHLQAEAKKRQATSTGGDCPQLVPKTAEAAKGSSRDIAAKRVGVGHSIVQRAYEVKKSAPELFHRIAGMRVGVGESLVQQRSGSLAAGSSISSARLLDRRAAASRPKGRLDSAHDTGKALDRGIFPSTARRGFDQ
jgi:hypothetical protein